MSEADLCLVVEEAKFYLKCLNLTFLLHPLLFVSFSDSCWVFFICMFIWLSPLQS